MWPTPLSWFRTFPSSPNTSWCFLPSLPTLPTPIQRHPLFTFLSHGFVLPGPNRHVNGIIPSEFLCLAFAPHDIFESHHLAMSPAVPLCGWWIHPVDVPQFVYPVSWSATFGCCLYLGCCAWIFMFKSFCRYLFSVFLSRCLGLESLGHRVDFMRSCRSVF